MISQLCLAFALSQQLHVDSEWPQKRLFIGHRGARARAPENTIPSFKLAMDLGADGIEFDVFLTNDRLPFVIHDDTLERTTNGEGVAWEKSWSQLKSLDAAKGWPEFKGATLPTLVETLNLMPDAAVVNIELKGEGIYLKEEFAETIIETIFESRKRLFIIVSSFDSELLEIMRAQDPTLRIGLLLMENHVVELCRSLKRMSAISPQAIHVPATLAKRWLVRLAHSKGLRVMVWTVNDAAQGRKLFEAGVDGIFSDLPEGFAVNEEKS